jgi:hypothetical protein
MYVVLGHEGATSATIGSRDPADRLVDQAIRSTRSRVDQVNQGV